MSKIIITYNEISELNHSLEDKGMDVKLHLHDTCGTQSFTVKTGASCDKEQLEAMKQMVTEYFKERNITVDFYEEDQGLQFVLS